jgi:PEP-CTERM motif-containing protein
MSLERVPGQPLLASHLTAPDVGSSRHLHLLVPRRSGATRRSKVFSAQIAMEVGTMRSRKLFLAVLALAIVFCLSATVEVSHAITTAFTHSSDYFSALGLAGVSLVTETYESLPLNSLIAAGSTVGPFTYSAFPAGVQGRVDNLFDRIGNQSLAASRPGNPSGGFFFAGDTLTVSFSPSTAVGVFINANVTPGSSDLFIATPVGFVGTGGPASNRDISNLYFAGLISDTPFTSAVIGSFGAGQGSSFNIDNLSIAPSPVPEPTTLLLFGTAMAGIGMSWRRRRRAT